jgi:hypothetical protein
MLVKSVMVGHCTVSCNGDNLKKYNLETLQSSQWDTVVEWQQITNVRAAANRIVVVGCTRASRCLTKAKSQTFCQMMISYRWSKETYLHLH